MVNLYRLALLLCQLCAVATAFSSPSVRMTRASRTGIFATEQEETTAAVEETGERDELIARRIVVEGDVQGGYYRSCVLNEAGRFRRLVGTMSPPDDSKVAEIYVEGKRHLVEGFVRWCEKGAKKIGLSQVVTVNSVVNEEPTGLYDEFYVKTK
mmetsp:Transcript_7705/g.21452  ORF Transcript_7705/g.21452 Transcript_7705/m.21452 type:complete len:154 (-) Transcript_7705:270-731(-)